MGIKTIVSFLEKKYRFWKRTTSFELLKNEKGTFLKKIVANETEFCDNYFKFFIPEDMGLNIVLNDKLKIDLKKLNLQKYLNKE